MITHRGKPFNHGMFHFPSFYPFYLFPFSFFSLFGWMFRDGKPNDFPNTVSSCVLGSVCICYLGATGENVVWRVRRSIKFLLQASFLDIPNLCLMGTHIPSYGDVCITGHVHSSDSISTICSSCAKPTLGTESRTVYLSCVTFLFPSLILILLCRSPPNCPFYFHLFFFSFLSYAELASLTLVFFFVMREVGDQTNSVEIQMLCDESRFLADEARQISALFCAIC